MAEHDHSEHKNLTPGRLEAFSDGVFAIIITITVLELKIPGSADLAALAPLVPLFVAYAISFQTVGTYWNNHHLLIRATKHIGTDIMWANLHLLFWLSLVPFTTAWVGTNHNATSPTAIYALVLFFAGFAYSILQFTIVRHADNREELVRELRSNKKGSISLVLYGLAVFAAFINPLISDALIVAVSLMWFVPDTRLTRFLNQ